MAKKRIAIKESGSLNVKASKPVDVNKSQRRGSPEHDASETSGRPDVPEPGRTDAGPETTGRQDAGPETTGRQDAEESDTFKLQADKLVEASGRQDANRVKLTLYLPADLARRFAVHAALLDLDRSELFAELVRAHCNRFEIRDREAPSAPGPGA